MSRQKNISSWASGTMFARVQSGFVGNFFATKAFPKEYTVDIEAVCNALSATSMAFNGALYSDETTEWRLLSGENISIPYRIYISDKLLFPNKLTERQILIYTEIIATIKAHRFTADVLFVSEQRKMCEK